MIVIGMAALVMTVTIPFVKRTIHRDAVYQAVHAIEDACQNARAAAIFNNATSELVIRPREKQVVVHPGHSAAVVRTSQADGEDGASPASAASAFQSSVKPFSGHLGEDVSIELLDVNFVELRDEEEARIRFHPNGTSDEFTIVLRIGASAWRKITLDLVTGLPTLQVMR